MRNTAIISNIIGRQSEIDSVRQMLASGARLVTLTGPGGVGKTRLAQEICGLAAGDFPDGVFFIPLDELLAASQVLPKIASVLEIPESGKQPVLEDLRSALADKHALLCIDNWEHVLEAAPQVVELLSACARLQVLATSREALRLRGEQEFPVAPLRIPSSDDDAQSPAVQLFVERARAASPTFALDISNASTVAAICAFLDGLPLAIELAAALVRLFSLPALLKRLQVDPALTGRSTTLQLLTGGARDLPVRQQTLRAAIGWSYDLLDEPDQRLFRRISIFLGGCELDAARTVCGEDKPDSRPVLDSLIALADKNLLRVEQIAGEPRFRMLRTIQEYALEQLQASGELPELRRRHMEYFLELVRQAEPGLAGADRGAWLERLDQEQYNLRVVLAWVLEHEPPASAYELGGVLWRYWHMRGYWTEGRQWLRRILEKEGEVSLALRAKVLNGSGGLSLKCGDTAMGRRHLTECLELRKQIQDKPGMAATHNNLGHLAADENDFETALYHARECLSLDQEIGDRIGLASDHLFVGRIMLQQNKMIEAEEHSRQGLTIAKELDDPYFTMVASTLLADIHYGQGRYDQTIQYLNQAIALAAEIGDRGQVSWLNVGLGLVALRRGEDQQAEKLITGSLSVAHELGDRLGFAGALEGLAYLAVTRGSLQKAARLWGAASAVRKTINSPQNEFEKIDSEFYLSKARAQMREKVFQVEMASGAAMSPEQALEYAQESDTASEEIPASKSGRQHYPAGLTAREAEVLVLVAQGLSDAKIAEYLVLSPRTINAHLTSIYSKLGVNSRTAATRFAVEANLV